MLEIPSLRPETRYGIPTADQLLFNRQYIVGYSFLFRQAKWTMEMIDPDNSAVNVDRIDVFREDLRVPESFRAALVDYKGEEGFDRGHLISSADRRTSAIKNSETFLLSNMSPQRSKFNRGIWKRLEEAVRDLSCLFLEAYVVCGPIFDINRPIKVIGDDSRSGEDVVIPVPHAYFKSVLAENHRGSLKLWSFILPNENSTKDLSEFLVKTTEVERRVGLQLWDKLRGQKGDKLRNRVTKMWDLEKAKAAANKRKERREADKRRKAEEAAALAQQ